MSGDGLLLKRVLQAGLERRCASGVGARLRHRACVIGHSFEHRDACVVFGDDPPIGFGFPLSVALMALWTMREREAAVFRVDGRLLKDCPGEPLWSQDGYEWIDDAYEWEVEVVHVEYSLLPRCSGLLLRGGLCIPRIGLGLYMVSATDAYDATLLALREGYRLIDTASMYQNEEAVGRALRDSGVPRSEVFVVSKVNNPDHGYQQALSAVERSLHRLGVGPVDFMLVHSPIGGRLLETWDALLEARRRGWAKQVGVSNFGLQHLGALEAAKRELPAANQIELSPFCQEPELRRYSEERSIAVMGYSPLTRGERFNDSRVVALARKHGRSPAQVLIRWALQQHIVPIPKTTRLERLRENLGSFDFELDSADMAQLDSCEENLHTCWNCLDVPWTG